MSKKYPYGEHKQCAICGKHGTKRNPVTYGQDPYDSEINDIHRRVWLCDSCYEDRQGDI